MSYRYPLKVFISYASQDRDFAHKLYDWLSDRGFVPWLDIESLIPGVEWEIEIGKAIESTDVIIVCLSKCSTTKEGYVQKEIRDALCAASKKPDGTIFLIPSRIEECEVPYNLRKYQWVNLYQEDGFDKLEKALQVRKRTLENGFSHNELNHQGRIGMPYSRTSTADSIRRAGVATAFRLGLEI